jgi:hypothetical protein
MFNLFATPKTTKEIREDMDILFPSWSWSTIIKDSNGNEIPVNELIQKYNDLLKENQQLKNDWHQPELCDEKISELTKEVLHLRDLKQENVDLLELLAKYKDGYQGSCYACEPVGILNQKQEQEIIALKNELQHQLDQNKKLDLQIVALHKIIEGAKTTINKQKHPMYPLHWGGYTDETPWETASADLALRVVKLEQELDKIKKKLNPKEDPNYEYFKKHGKWPYDVEDNNPLHKGY